MYCPFHYFHPALTDESKSSVRNDLQRTGAEINQLFSFESLPVKLWRKTERNELFFILYKFMKFNLYIKFNVNMLTLSTPYQIVKTEKIEDLDDFLSEIDDRKERKKVECFQNKNISSQNDR